MNRPKIKSTLLKALREAGKILKRSLNERRVIAKKSELSLVTVTDRKSEETILKMIRHEFPDHGIVAEESLPKAKTSSPSRWLVDPLDGTTNFAHTFPVACVSIGYEENGVVEIGGVLDPFRNELFFAECGKGATLNGKKISVSKTAILSESLLATGFPYDRKERIESHLAPFKAFMMKTQCIRRMGAAAIDLCYVACGRYDGFWELLLNPWDTAAGTLIVQEAGGTISNYGGGPFKLEEAQTLASNGLIHPEMLDVLKPYREMR
ncbi:MAG: inositol monophosphatase family protein [Candidatus Omnitrophica bacterium]|nr:inositol monophosphatase family protein [Candidatus Omnitrophota bacterium]MDD5672034.1 inositol monophosphatase family protein [Candidatus Omnitrophota bacterium]